MSRNYFFYLPQISYVHTLAFIHKAGIKGIPLEVLIKIYATNIDEFQEILAQYSGLSYEELCNISTEEAKEQFREKFYTPILELYDFEKVRPFLEYTLKGFHRTIKNICEKFWIKYPTLFELFEDFRKTFLADDLELMFKKEFFELDQESLALEIQSEPELQVEQQLESEIDIERESVTHNLSQGEELLMKENTKKAFWRDYHRKFLEKSEDPMEKIKNEAERLARTEKVMDAAEGLIDGIFKKFANQLSELTEQLNQCGHRNHSDSTLETFSFIKEKMKETINEHNQECQAVFLALSEGIEKMLNQTVTIDDLRKLFTMGFFEKLKEQSQDDEALLSELVGRYNLSREEKGLTYQLIPLTSAKLEEKIRASTGKSFQEFSRMSTEEGFKAYGTQYLMPMEGLIDNGTAHFLRLYHDLGYPDFPHQRILQKNLDHDAHLAALILDERQKTKGAYYKKQMNDYNNLIEHDLDPNERLSHIMSLNDLYVKKIAFIENAHDYCQQKMMALKGYEENINDYIHALERRKIKTASEQKNKGMVMIHFLTIQVSLPALFSQQEQERHEIALSKFADATKAYREDESHISVGSEELESVLVTLRESRSLYCNLFDKDDKEFFEQFESYCKVVAAYQDGYVELSDALQNAEQLKKLMVDRMNLLEGLRETIQGEIVSIRNDYEKEKERINELTTTLAIGQHPIKATSPTLPCKGVAKLNLSPYPDTDHLTFTRYCVIHEVKAKDPGKNSNHFDATRIQGHSSYIIGNFFLPIALSAAPKSLVKYVNTRQL